MAQITYTDKDKSGSDGVVNKWRDVDANEVKTVVNTNATALDAKQALVNAATALTDGANIALTAIKHSLTSDEAAITFTIPYTGDDITIELTLNATSSTWTFPATALCVSEGTAS